jgi:hypothetical protein
VQAADADSPGRWNVPQRTSSSAVPSVHDEQSGAVWRITPVGLHAVADLISHSRTKDLHAAIFQFGVKLALQT